MVFNLLNLGKVLTIGFSNSLCGYKEAATFKFVGEEEITYTESYIKTKLFTFFDDIERDSCEKIDRTNFFGKYYLTTPQSFEFTQGERLLILQMANHVKKILDRNDQPNSGIKYFAFDETDKKLRKTIHKGTTYYSQFCGRFFTFGNEMMFKGATNPEEETVIANDLEKLKSQLFQDVSKWLKSHAFKNKLEFEQEMVSLEKCHGKIIGFVSCVFCKSCNNSKRTKISLKSSDDRNSYWVLSNFVTHVKRCHSACLKVNKVQNSDETDETAGDVRHECSKRRISSSKGNIVHDKKQKKLQAKKQDRGILKNHRELAAKSKLGIVDESIYLSETIIYETEQIIPDFESNHPEVSIDEIEKMIYEQISQQMLKMMECTIKIGQTKHEMSFDVNESAYIVSLSEIFRDGHCLFRSLAHQIWKEVLGTQEQNETSLKLRADVVSYIDSHFPSFLWELRGAVWERFGNVPNIEDECKRYIAEDLAISAWGGAETIKAVSQMYKVNILVINESGNCYYPFSFNMSYQESIVIAYRLKVKEGNDNSDLWDTIIEDESTIIEETSINSAGDLLRDHYDSVINIDADVILKIAKCIAAIEFRKINHLECSHISIDPN